MAVFKKVKTNTGKRIPDAVRHHDKKQLYRQRGPARYIYELYILKSKNFNRELKKLFLNENLKSGSTMIDFVNSDEDFETPPPVPHAQSR